MALADWGVEERAGGYFGEGLDAHVAEVGGDDVGRREAGGV